MFELIEKTIVNAREVERVELVENGKHTHFSICMKSGAKVATGAFPLEKALEQTHGLMEVLEQSATGGGTGPLAYLESLMKFAVENPQQVGEILHSVGAPEKVVATIVSVLEGATPHDMNTDAEPHKPGNPDCTTCGGLGLIKQSVPVPMPEIGLESIMVSCPVCFPEKYARGEGEV